MCISVVTRREKSGTKGTSHGCSGTKKGEDMRKSANQPEGEERKKEASKQLRKVGRKEETKGASKEGKDRWTTFEEGASEEVHYEMKKIKKKLL